MCRNSNNNEKSRILISKSEIVVIVYIFIQVVKQNNCCVLLMARKEAKVSFRQFYISWRLLFLVAIIQVNIIKLSYLVLDNISVDINIPNNTTAADIAESNKLKLKIVAFIQFDESIALK